MKVFIAGAKAIKSLDDLAIKQLERICKKQHNILVGDCYGVDSAVQRFCLNLPYNNVTVFASNGKARNNLGGWKVENVPVASGVKGFDFYRQKDIAMAEAAECGFMIWDGKSKGTYQNIITLLEMKKKVLVYIVPKKLMIRPKISTDLKSSIKQPKAINEQISLY